MRNPWDDVVLTDSTSYLVTDGNYKEHLEEAKESKDQSLGDQPGEHQLAQSEGYWDWSHGLCLTWLLLPLCCCGLSEGREMNIDYSLSGVLKTVSDLPQVLILYDVMYQYDVHLLYHFTESSHLTMPTNLEIIKGISIWHIHGHQNQNIVGSFNQISRSTWTMATSHWRETLDAHMADSNWKKWIKMVLTICKRYIKARAAFKASQEAFQLLNSATDPRLVEQWAGQEQNAAIHQQNHPNLLDIYDI
ncbi:hypothetical protein EW146_g10384 [Bondarzewia mesenterica]|uniref:Uncharacterized protein n=1 Tax=Bondarzewia mesenterica TaxID=1095465 RepID=A0A4S4KXN8_9AGAM|nr:hypothetical protein EW146_g10384 [Bondarzewia mesenterica]